VYEDFHIHPPFFEIGPKAYVYGKKALELARHAEKLSLKYHVDVIFTPQYADILLISQNTQHLYVFAQHADAIEVGKGVGSVLLESLKEAGASGVLLNHAEKRVSLSSIHKTIRRADSIGLATLVCADTCEEAAAIAHLGPNMILAESPARIGKKQDRIEKRTEVRKINETVAKINPKIKVLHSAGIYTAEDVKNILSSGAQGTGSTSGIIKAEDPYKAMEDMLASMRKTWDSLRQ
jgi:triosephosphate isomerase (TIM)